MASRFIRSIRRKGLTHAMQHAGLRRRLDDKAKRRTFTAVNRVVRWRQEIGRELPTRSSPGSASGSRRRVVLFVTRLGKFFYRIATIKRPPIMNKHTDGPWMFDPSSNNVWATAPTGDNLHIATVRGWGHFQRLGDGPETMQANGRLIAAAPQLLEALKVCRAKIAYMLANGEWYSPAEAVAIADAVIAKVQNSTPTEEVN